MPTRNENGIFNATVLAMAFFLLIAPALTQRVVAAGQLSVHLYFVNISSHSQAVKSDWYACGDGNLAGPFMSAGSAIDWRDGVLKDENAKIVDRLNTDPGVCTGPPLFYDVSKGWHRE